MLLQGGISEELSVEGREDPPDIPRNLRKRKEGEKRGGKGEIWDQ